MGLGGPGGISLCRVTQLMAEQAKSPGWLIPAWDSTQHRVPRTHISLIVKTVWSLVVSMLAVWLWASCFFSLNFNFFFSKVRYHNTYSTKLLGLNKILYVKEKFPSVRSYNINCSVVFCLKGSRPKHLFHDRKAQLAKSGNNALDISNEQVIGLLQQVFHWSLVYRSLKIIKETILAFHRYGQFLQA